MLVFSIFVYLSHPLVPFEEALRLIFLKGLSRLQGASLLDLDATLGWVVSLGMLMFAVVWLSLRQRQHQKAQEHHELQQEIERLKQRLQEQDSSQQQLQNLFSITPSLNCTVGFDGYFQLISPSFGRLLGYSLEEIQQQPFLHFVHPEDQAATQEELDAISKGKHTLGFENRYRCRDGSYHWLSWYSIASLPDNIVYATAVDITERKQEQFELTQRHLGFKLLADLILQIRKSRQIDEVFELTAKSIQLFLKTNRVLILELTPQGCIARAESVLPGHSKIIGQSFLDPCFATDYVTKYQDGKPSMMSDIATAEITECHRELLLGLGVKSNIIAPIFLHQEIWGLMVAHQCDHPRAWTAIEADLLKQAADQISVGLAQWQLLNQLESLVEERTAALVRSENQFRSLFTAAPDLIYLLDPHLHIQRINPSVIQTLGYSESELRNQPLTRFVAPVDQHRCGPGFERLMEEGVHRATMELVCKDLSHITVDCSCTVVNPDDDPFILVVQRDISEQKAVEAMKDEFVAVVSHELRTPLTSIHGSLKLLGTGNLGDLSSQGSQVLEIALRNTERLNRLINDVLDLERIESGKVVMSKQSCKVDALLTQSAQEMQSMADQHQIQLEISPMHGDVWADPDHVIQTLTNLLSNAIKFSSPNSKVWMNAVAQDNEILFEVSDRGRGIPKDQVKHIFERFRQVDVSDSRKKGGTGLGLAICQQIIERHGGRIWAESQEGQGSSFYFTLPQHSA